MKLLVRLALAALVNFAAIFPAGAVGFQMGLADDPGHPGISVAIWYPSADETRAQAFGPYTQTVAMNGSVQGRDLPLIVMSHGTGGSMFNSYTIAIALAEAGFVVAAPTHTGDNYRDHAVSFTRRNFEDRPRQISRVVDYMLTDWQEKAALDPARIGVFGHSAGGTTALILVGGRADWSKVVTYCRSNADDWGCRNAGAHEGPAEPEASQPIDARDPRIKAALLAAPALSHAFLPDGLSSIAVPVQLWVAEKDEIVTDAAALRTFLPTLSGYVEVMGGGHFAFLSPCNDILNKAAPEICTDPTGFDRDTFLRRAEIGIADFFRGALAK